MDYAILGRPWQDVALSIFEAVGLWILVRDVKHGGTINNAYNAFWFIGNSVAIVVAISLTYWIEATLCIGYVVIRGNVIMRSWLARKEPAPPP